MDPILLLILFIVFCVVTAILSICLLKDVDIEGIIKEGKDNKRREEKRIRELRKTPAYISVDIENRLILLYEYIRVFPEKEQDCQKLLSLIHKTKDEIARLADKEVISEKERKKIRKRIIKVRTKYNKREVELLEYTPGDIKCEMFRTYHFLYDYFEAFPEKKQDYQEFYSLIDKTLVEAARLEEKSGHYCDM